MNQPRAKHSMGWLLLLGALTSVGPVSIDLYLPVFSLIKAELGQGIEETLAAYMFGVAIGQLIYGPVSDRFGRKPPLYVALLLYALGSLGCALSDDMTLLIASRFVQALGGCAGVVIARAVVRDCYEAHEAARVFSTLILITAIGPIVAPLAGSVLASLMGWRALFYAQALFGVLLWLSVYVGLRETGEPGRSLSFAKALRGYGDLLRDRGVSGHALIAACMIAVIFCYIASAPTVLMASYGLSAHQFAVLMGVNSLSFVIASQFNLRRLRQRTPAQLLRVAVWVPVLFAAATMAANWRTPTDLWLLVLLQLGIFIGAGHIVPNATAQALANQGARAGAASALIGCIQSLASTLAGAAMGLFTKGGVHIMSLLMLIGTLMMLIAHRWLGRR